MATHSTEPHGSGESSENQSGYHLCQPTSYSFHSPKHSGNSYTSRVQEYEPVGDMLDPTITRE